MEVQASQDSLVGILPMNEAGFNADRFHSPNNSSDNPAADRLWPCLFRHFRNRVDYGSGVTSVFSELQGFVLERCSIRDGALFS